jgi:hypothetical protein
MRNVIVFRRLPAGLSHRTAQQPTERAVNKPVNRKVRLVVGLFDTVEGLTAALRELGAGRLQPDQIRIIAPVHALGGGLDIWPAGGDGLGFGAWIVCRPAEGPFPWSLALADPGRSAPHAVEDARALLELHHWALRRQAEQVDGHLRAGGALLLVEPESDDEERAACTALLRHASGGIQTHDIAR